MHRALVIVSLVGLAACRGGQESSTAVAQNPPATPQPSAAAAGSPPAPATPPAAGEPEVAPVAAAPRAQSGSAFEVAGVATAVRNTRLSMKAGGVLTSIKAREGAWVKQGQALCSLDTVDLAIRAEGAEVAYKQAKAGAESAQQDLKRARDLYAGGAATDQIVEKAELAATIAKLETDAARVALKSAQQALADATLRAPFAGVITKVLAEEGMMVTTMPPTVIFALVDTSVLEVRVPIPERMLSQVKLGQPVTVVLPAVKAERQAKVDRIPEVIDPVTRSVEAVIRIDNEGGALPAGLYARVRFPGVDPEQAAMVPEGSMSGVAP